MTTLYWRISWQRELLSLLRQYDSLRSGRRRIYPYLLLFFYFINMFCFWMALSLSFPELLQEQFARMVKIQQPVAILGGLFDSLSFFITVWLVRKAAVSKTGLKFLGILSIDLFIAVVATAWVLLVVMFSSWLIGPPLDSTEPVQTGSLVSLTVDRSTTADFVDSQPENPQGATEGDFNAPTQEPGDNTSNVAASLQTGTEDGNTAMQQDVAITEVTGGADMVASVNEFDPGFYQDLLVSALRNPTLNIKYFIFAIIMGLSTMLPTGFHIFMATKSLVKTPSGE